MTSPYHADRPAMQVTAALIALSQKLPSVRPDVEDILFSTPELRGLMQGVCTISDAPTDDPERTLLLFCPEQGGWQTGVSSRANGSTSPRSASSWSRRTSPTCRLIP